MILKLARGKREAGQRGREEGLSQWKEQTLQITEVASSGASASGSQQLDSGGEAGAERQPRARSQGPARTVLLCDFGKSPSVSGPRKKNKWSLGILELEVVAAISFLGSWDQDPQWGR